MSSRQRRTFWRRASRAVEARQRRTAALLVRLQAKYLADEDEGAR